MEVVKPRNTWIITDTHFGHDRMVEYCNRPKNFNELIIRHWRKMIHPRDLVYHLGDVGWANRNQLFDLMKSLPGTKILIKGNHDREKTDWYLNHGFAAVLDFAAVETRTNMWENGEYFLYTRVLLSHRPMIIPKLLGYKTINIFGHFHNHTFHDLQEAGEGDLVKRLTTDHYLFSLEWTGYKPVLLKRAVKDNWVRRFAKGGKGRRWLEKIK